MVGMGQARGRGRGEKLAMRKIRQTILSWPTPIVLSVYVVLVVLALIPSLAWYGLRSAPRLVGDFRDEWKTIKTRAYENRRTPTR